MAILVTCTSCAARFRAKEKYRGERAKCPKCSAALVLDGNHVADFDVFVSYSSRDKHAADAVCASLESKRLRCWIAPRDILPGAEWGGAIIDAIGNTRVMVLLFSANSNQSAQVIREVERAVHKGLPIIPLRLEDAPLSKNMEYFISASHWLDAKNGPSAEHLERLRKTIESLLIERADADLPGDGGDEPPAHSNGWRPSQRQLITAGVGLALLAVGALVMVLMTRGGQAHGSAATAAPATTPTSPSTQPQLAPPIVNSVGIRFAYIPAGRFMMGARDGDYQADRDERPRHAVVITKPFYMAAYELTYGQYQAVMHERPETPPFKNRRFFEPTNENIPVGAITAEQAKAVCETLASLPAEVAAHRSYRLPTEAEWEYACRAGTNNIYIGRDVLTIDQANFKSPERGDFEKWTVGGTYLPNPWGLYDMLGNVREWCSDFKGPYRPEEQTDPTGPRVGRFHVIRGGGVVDPAQECRASARSKVDEKTWKDNRPRAGVRIVCVVDDSGRNADGK